MFIFFNMLKIQSTDRINSCSDLQLAKKKLPRLDWKLSISWFSMQTLAKCGRVWPVLCRGIRGCHRLENSLCAFLVSVRVGGTIICGFLLMIASVFSQVLFNLPVLPELDIQKVFAP